MPPAYDKEKKLDRVASQPADTASESVGSGGSSMLDRLLSLKATMDSKLDGKLSSIVGIVIITICSSALNFCGLRAILEYQKYAWAIFFVLFMTMYGEMAPRADIDTKSTLTGNDEAGAVLSLLAVVYGSSVSWATIAADYYVQHPIKISKFKVFTLTTMGIGISTCIDMELADVYEEQGVGFLIQTMLFPRGFAKFVLVVLVLAGIGMNCINFYSSALSVQQFARPLACVPRFVWTIMLFGITLGIATGGRESLNAYLQNFLSLLGYWATSFFIIL
ncbi:hypothetical protein FJTKL_12087 [Diaporthe vaccinii]|uniref:Uncharacterized protein n=1 Tax=Diaporthe vaccinii TaxID=105482 RepID=A0ABR4EF94_9PEZI